MHGLAYSFILTSHFLTSLLYYVRLSYLLDEYVMLCYVMPKIVGSSFQ